MIKHSSTKKSADRRVVVTGLGVVSSLGIGWVEFWANLIAGNSGISKITSFDTSKYDRHYGGEVKNFDPEKFISKERLRKYGRTSQLAIVAAKLALKDAKVPKDKKSNIAISIGTTGGERRLMELINRERLGNGNKSDLIEKMNACLTSSLASNVGVELKIKGYTNVLSTACSSGNYAICEGFDLIKNGEFDYALVGGADSFSEMVFTGFCRLNAVAPKKCQPFDKNRKGMIPAEGSGFLFLETMESAIHRKIKPYAEILGCGLSCDARHITDPSSLGISKAISKALKNSNVSIDSVDYINVHGTGTQENDLAECGAIHKVFGRRGENIPVSSIKSMLGHTMGSAAALESISCCLTLVEGVIPPTINLIEKDPLCQIDGVFNKACKKNVRIVLKNAQAFGGNNACVIFKKIE